MRSWPRCLLLGDAVDGQLRLVAGKLAVAYALDEIVFHAAAGDGAGDLTVVAHGQQRARRPRRRAPGLDDGGQHYAAALVEPLGRAFQYLQIDAVHDADSCLEDVLVIPDRK
jgi:hypothetical protein